MRRGLLTVLLSGLLVWSVWWSATAEQRSTAVASTPRVSETVDHQSVWAFEETFDGDPASPSQALLPQTFDYVVTHRSHPKEHFTKQFGPFPADHGPDCTGPDPAISPLPQHAVISSHTSRGDAPDASFYICKNHMMSALGDVEGYSVSAFWPKQEFDFSAGGVLEFDVNLNGDHPRSWWELLITPREELKVGAARSWLPIDETYPQSRILFDFTQNKRSIEVGMGALDPEGILASAADWQRWVDAHPSDPANSDRRIRRTMRITLADDQIVWGIEMENGAFDEFVLELPNGLPFTRGLVVFKTHAYTPEKDGNIDNYTFHWDNLRFDGPVVGRYGTFEAEEVVYLQANGSRPIGDSQTVTIDLPEVGASPVLFGQVHNPLRGQVLLSINGRSPISVDPYDYTDNACSSSGWKSFRLPLSSSWLRPGENSFEWTVGPRPACAADGWPWDGFSVKSLEIQVDLIPETVGDERLYVPLVIGE